MKKSVINQKFTDELAIVLGDHVPANVVIEARSHIASDSKDAQLPPPATIVIKSDLKKPIVLPYDGEYTVVGSKKHAKMIKRLTSLAS